MDPFAVLPPELAVQVLLLVVQDHSRRPDYLRAALHVSRLWYAVATNPALWSELDLKLTPSGIPVEDARRRLQRAQGGLRVLRMEGEIFSSPLWDGPLQAACASGALIDLSLACFQKPIQIEPERLVVIAEAAGSSGLRSLRIEGWDCPQTFRLVREILQRSFHLRKLEVNIRGRLTSVLDESWLPILSETDDKGIRPLEKMESLRISLWSPLLWEHLSCVRVKLVRVSLSSSGYTLNGVRDLDESGRVLQHILDVIGGPGLQEFEFPFTPYHPKIEAAVFKHPRRRVTVDLASQKEAGSDPRPMLGALEKLKLYSWKAHLFDLWFGPNYRCLRHLSLHDPSAEDEILAKAIRSVSGSLESLEITFWEGKREPADQTLPARYDFCVSYIAMGFLTPCLNPSSSESRPAILPSVPGFARLLSGICEGTRANF